MFILCLIVMIAALFISVILSSKIESLPFGKRFLQQIKWYSRDFTLPSTSLKNHWRFFADNYKFFPAGIISWTGIGCLFTFKKPLASVFCNAIAQWTFTFSKSYYICIVHSEIVWSQRGCTGIDREDNSLVSMPEQECSLRKKWRSKLYMATISMPWQLKY